MSHMCVLCMRAYIVFIYNRLYFCVLFFSHLVVLCARLYQINEFLLCVCVSFSIRTHTLARWLQFSQFVRIRLCLSFLWSNKNNIYFTLLLLVVAFAFGPFLSLVKRCVWSTHTFPFARNKWIWFVFYDFFSSLVFVLFPFFVLYKRAIS